MTKRVYGRSPSLIAKRAEEMSTISISALQSLICRAEQCRPQNENAIRGIY